MKHKSLLSRYRELYFKERALFEIFRRLHQLGADLDYVFFLVTSLLWFFDCSDLVRRQPKKTHGLETEVLALVERLEPWGEFYSGTLAREIAKVSNDLQSLKVDFYPQH